jgi:hypothetical protein
MSVKSIFQEGMKERRRRKSLGQRGRELREKEQALASRLTDLGQKAWEANADITAFADLRAALGDAQRTIDDLRGQAEQLLRQQQEAEQARSRESGRLAAAVKDADEGLQGVQRSLGEQKGTLQAAQRESQRARERLAAVARERGQLQGKAAGADASEAEKDEIARGLALLEKEESSLRSGLDASEAAVRPAAALVASLQEQADAARKKLDASRLEQKQALGELDKALAAAKEGLARNAEKAREADARRRESYRGLGEKLAAVPAGDPALAGETAAVGAARTEMEGVRAMIGGLERQRDQAQVSAYKKMMAMLIGGALLLLAIIVALVLLLAPRRRPAPLAGLPQGQGEALRRLGQLADSLPNGLGGIAAASEQAQGGAIEIASEAELRAALPAVPGWRLRDPRYSLGTYEALRTSSLQAGYDGPGGPVRIQLTDAGTASALLEPLKMVIAMGIRVDDAGVMQQTGTVGGLAVVERVDKKTGEATLGLIHKDRFLVELKTRADGGLGLLRTIAAAMDLSRLP